MNLSVIDMIRTEQNIARLQKQAGLSVRDLQDVFGFATPQTIYKWQQGVALPTIDNLVVAAILQVRLDDILVTDTAAHEWKTGKRNNKITTGWKMPAVRSLGLKGKEL